jgi:hypothetical protein
VQLRPTDIARVSDGSIPVEYVTLLKSAVRIDPSLLISLGLLKIIDKDGKTIPLVPSYTQGRLLDLVLHLIDAGEPVRVNCLKARQVYISTIVEAILYAYTSQWKNIRSIVIADDDDGAEYLFGMQKTMHTHMIADWPYLLEKTKRNTLNRLEWESLQSWVMTDTAQNVNAGRKYTYRFVHNSEAAFYPDFDTLTTGLYQSVPKRPRTMIINESTANGMSGGFYNQVMDCYRPKGKYNDELGVWESPGGWKLLFIAWYEHPEYRMPTAGEMISLDGIHFASDQGKNEFLAREADLRVEIRRHHERLISRSEMAFPYKDMPIDTIIQQQLNWRRDTIKDKCHGDPQQFDQEYPDSVDTAFLASGRPAINIAVVQKNIILSRWSRPAAIGSFRWTNPWEDETGKKRFGPKILNGVCLNAGALRVAFDEDSHGLWKIWRRPERGYLYRYCAGADCAEGLEQGDYDYAAMLDRLTQWNEGTQFIQAAATFMGHLDTDEFADQLVMACIYYEMAYMAVERDKYGLSVIKRAVQMYYRFYYRNEFRTGYAVTTDEIGFMTNEQSKKDLVATLNEHVRTGQYRSPDPDFWGQARTFVRDQRGRLGAQGKREDPSVRVYDDAVMGNGIALQCHLWMPKCTKIVQPVTGWRRKLLKQSAKGPMSA